MLCSWHSGSSSQIEQPHAPGASEIASYSTTPHFKRRVAWRPVLAREDQDGNPKLLVM